MEDWHCIALGVAGQPHFSKRQEAQKACRIPEGSRGKNPALTPAQACNTRMKETKLNSTKTGNSMKQESREETAVTGHCPKPHGKPWERRAPRRAALCWQAGQEFPLCGNF